MIKETDNNITWSKISKELPNKKRVLDFQKISKTGYKFVLLITGRGAAGKSLNAKLEVKRLFDKTGEEAVWLMNTQKQIRKEKREFLKDATKSSVKKSIDTEAWKKLKPKGSTDDLNVRIEDDKENTIFKLTALNSAEYNKGSRPPITTLVYDEFNVGINKVQQPVHKFMSLLHSYEDIVNGGKQFNIWIFGNNKSLNHPLLFKLGITKIDKEYTTYETGTGRKFMLIIVPKLDDQQIAKMEEENVDNIIYNIAKQVGTAEHAYHNKTLYDEINNVKSYWDDGLTYLILEKQFTIYTDGSYYSIYKHKFQNFDTPYYHIKAVQDKPNDEIPTIVFNRKDLKEGYIIRKDIQKNLIKQIVSNNVQFEDVVSRELFINSLR